MLDILLKPIFRQQIKLEELPKEWSEIVERIDELNKDDESCGKS